MRHSPKFQRFVASSVVALLAANSVVLVVGLADASGSAPGAAVTAGRTITLITGPDGKQVAVDPTTPAGWKAIAAAQQRGDKVVTVPLPAAASTGNQQTIPGINPDDLQQLLAGTLDEITTTVLTTVDSLGHTVVSIIDGTGATVTSIVDGAETTVSSVVGDTATTASSVVDNTATTIQNTATTIQNTATTIQNTATTIQNTVTTIVQTTPTTIQNTVTTIQNTATSLVQTLPVPPVVLGP